MNVIFRDGPRDLPDHLAELMDQLETYKMTYEEAVVAANDKLLSDHLNKIQAKTIARHFEDWRRS